MALTRIHSGQSFVRFIQPTVGDEVIIRIDVQIDWINQGYYVHIPGGGIYEVTNVNVFNYTIKLIDDYVGTGNVISVEVIHPVPKSVMDRLDGIIDDNNISLNTSFSSDYMLRVLKEWGISDYSNRMNIKTPNIN